MRASSIKRAFVLFALDARFWGSHITGRHSLSVVPLERLICNECLFKEFIHVGILCIVFKERFLRPNFLILRQNFRNQSQICDYIFSPISSPVIENAPKLISALQTTSKNPRNVSGCDVTLDMTWKRMWRTRHSCGAWSAGWFVLSDFRGSFITWPHRIPFDTHTQPTPLRISRGKSWIQLQNTLTFRLTCLRKRKGRPLDATKRRALKKFAMAIGNERLHAATRRARAQFASAVRTWTQVPVLHSRSPCVSLLHEAHWAEWRSSWSCTSGNDQRTGNIFNFDVL